MQITRKQFLVASVGAVGAIAGLGSAACGSDSAASSGGGDCKKNGGTAEISSNHGHKMSVTAADVSAGALKDYDIHGTATHTHTVELSAVDFAQLQQNKSVSVVSSTTNNHSHPVTITCA